MRAFRPFFSRTTILATATFLTLAVIPRTSAKSLGWNADSLSLELSGIEKLPPAAEGVSDLKFSEFFRTPVGPRGLEPTEKLQALVGKRVRVLGFMVRQNRPSPGVAILAPYTLATHESEYGLCDDLPPAVIFVDVPKFRDLAVPFTPGPLLLTGTLELGAKEEADGRVSLVRLKLEPEPAPSSEPVAAAPTGTLNVQRSTLNSQVADQKRTPSPRHPSVPMPKPSFPSR